MNESKTEIRVQFKSASGFFGAPAEGFRNEFVMQLKPKDTMYMKMNIKKPGLAMDAITAELNLTYKDRCAAHTCRESKAVCPQCCCCATALMCVCAAPPTAASARQLRPQCATQTACFICSQFESYLSFAPRACAASTSGCPRRTSASSSTP
jgi:Glucose-6-phosphate dehydrogenase, C-terminal domain